MNAGVPYVLLADDDSEICSTLEKCFLKAGWRFDLVSDGTSALEAASVKSYDVVIADSLIPGLHGVELLKAIQEKNPAQAIIVVASGNSVDDAVTLLREGALDYLQKPIDFAALELAVNRIVSGKKEEEVFAGVFAFVEAQTTNYSFSSVEVNQGKACLLINEQLYRAGAIDLDTKLKIELAYQEALTNALEHGNLELLSAWKEELDPQGIDKYSRVKKERLADPGYGQRRISIATHYQESVLKIVIKDGGGGFMTSDVSGNKVPISLQCHGRGISLISKIMDQVLFDLQGSQITMIKHLDCAGLN